MTTIKYSETFYSPQGEGKYVGVPSLWIRFFLCNLQCDGFGQTDPTDPSSYDLPYEKIDVTEITDVMDLPVFEKGCDSRADVKGRNEFADHRLIECPRNKKKS